MTPWLQNPTYIFGHPFHLFICWFTNSLNVNAFKSWLMWLGGCDQGPAFDDNESACVSQARGHTKTHTHNTHHNTSRIFIQAFYRTTNILLIANKSHIFYRETKVWVNVARCVGSVRSYKLCIPLSCRGELLGMMERPNYDSPSGININLFSFIWIFTRQKSSLGISKTLRSKS